MQLKITNESIYHHLNKLMSWLEEEKFKSYDWWDIWGTKFGSTAKVNYVEKKLSGILAVIPIIFLDLVYPNSRKFFVDKRTFPICHAHIGLGYLNLYETLKDESYLIKALSLVEPLLKMSSPKANGLGWGMKHEWMTVQGLVPSDTPCNTQTAYSYDFFLRLYEITKDQIYLEYLKKIAFHVFNDFHETIDGDIISCSYSTIDNRRVVNANSYRMFMLLDAGKRFGDNNYIEKGIKTLNYIKKMQNDDGSWPYSEDQDFIDHYHTCFVLKNIIKVKNILGVSFTDYEEMFLKGENYFNNNLFYSNSIPKPYTKKPRLVLQKYDSYDIAESINLLIELKQNKTRIGNILNFLFDKFQSKEGWFRFRLYKFPLVNHIPYMRYANSAIFLSLTKALKYYNE